MYPQLIQNTKYATRHYIQCVYPTDPKHQVCHSALQRVYPNDPKYQVCYSLRYSVYPPIDPKHQVCHSALQRVYPIDPKHQVCHSLRYSVYPQLIQNTKYVTLHYSVYTQLIQNTRYVTFCIKASIPNWSKTPSKSFCITACIPNWSKTVTKPRQSIISYVILYITASIPNWSKNYVGCKLLSRCWKTALACLDCINCSGMCACLPALGCWRWIVWCMYVSCTDSNVRSCLELWSALRQSSWIRRCISVKKYKIKPQIIQSVERYYCNNNYY